MDGIELVTGGDARLLYHDQAVAVVPLRTSRDVRGSVLEPMAAGVPVVSTSHVREQVQARAGRDVIVADAPADVAREIAGLLESPAQRGAIGAQGRRFAWANFRWELFAGRLEGLLRGVVDGRPGTGDVPEPKTQAALGG